MNLVIVSHTNLHIYTHGLRLFGEFPILQLSQASHSIGNACINYNLLSQCHRQLPASVPRVQRVQTRAV